MISFDCDLVCVNQGLPVTATLMSGIAQELYSFMMAGSLNEIQLSPQISGIQPVLGQGQASDALLLHQILTNAIAPITNPLMRIAVLYASTYNPAPGVLGLMFDRGFVTTDDPNPNYTFTPRKGCAVFVDAIAQLRGQGTPGFESELLFTTIHEVGHIFNLDHVMNVSFMRPSQTDAAYGPNAYFFVPEQQSWLSECQINPNVMPGASIFEASSSANLAGELKKARPSLEFQIDVYPKEAWRFEPIQLDISLSTKRKGITQIPEIIDPSHRSFRVIIEWPNGERRLYRPTLRACSTSGVVEIGKDHPYLRDIPIFGQSGGFTFERSGINRVWAEIELNGHLIKSNMVELNIKEDRRTDPKWRQLNSVLQHPLTAAMMFDKKDNQWGGGLALLDHLLVNSPQQDANGILK